MKREIDIIDELLEKPCYIMDILPEQVKKDSTGHFFYVETYLLNGGRHYAFKDKFVGVILKLMCYYHVSILWNGWLDRPLPSTVECIASEIMDHHSGTLNVLLAEVDTLVVFDWDCLYISVYNPPEKVRSIMEKIACSEGLFWRKAGRGS